MRIVLLAGLCLFVNCSGLLFAQNKTLGVGTSTPNPNTALHIESPTGNQGFMMPRLTTVQRDAMISLLTAGDKGLMLYDTDLGAIFIWDGIAWKSSAQFTNDNPASTADGINVVTKGLGSAGRFRTDNTKSKMPTVWAETNSDSALSAPIYGLHTGRGDVAASFRINNTASTFSALYGETNGSGAAVFGSQIGSGRGGQFQITNAANANAALRSFTSGTGYAGFYTINNTANASAGIFSQTNGTGAAIFGENTGTGSAGKFIVNNINSPNPALWAETNSNNSLSAPIYGLHTGLGDNAAVFRLSNPANAYAAVYATTSGPGAGLRAENTGSGNGFAATFDVTNSFNQFPAVQVSNAGPAAAVRVMQPKGTGSGVDIYMQNPGSQGYGVYVDQGGTGYAGSFNITNGSNSSHAVQAITKGAGSAGQFETANPANVSPTITASHGGDGIAFAIWKGGVQVTTMDVTTSIIPARAAAYRLITGGTSFSLGFTPANGEVFMIYNETGQQITFVASGITHTLNPGEGKTFISFGTNVRGF